MTTDFILSLGAAADGEVTKAFAPYTGAGAAAPIAKLEAAGRWFEVLALRLRQATNVTDPDFDAAVREIERKALDPSYAYGTKATAGADAAAVETEQFSEDLFDKTEPAHFATLDPANWKHQDHYEVMGLSKIRWDATEEIIRQAFKRKVLIHHPDKKAGKKSGSVDDEDNFFKCLKKANEILSDTVKRRSYDSVDPTFNNNVPEVTDKNKKNFFAVFGPVIQRNAHFFKKQPMPLLGGPDATEDEVNAFYAAWYNEETWREFSYEDEEDTEKGDNRDEKRWIDKANKAARAKKRTAEVGRMRTLIDNTSLCDPRLAEFKRQADDKKNFKKREKQAAANAAAEEKAKKIKEEQEAKAAAEAAAKLALEKAKNDKEEIKKQFRTQRKRLRNVCKDNNYFVADPNDLVRQMETTEMLCEKLSLDRLKALNDAIEANKADANSAFDEEIARLRHDEAEAKVAVANRQTWEQRSQASAAREWSVEDNHLLVKAVKAHPPGSVNRWEAIAENVNRATTSTKFNVTEVIAKAKELQKLGGL
ncbi:zuotin, variant [Capsaspora owczarzaki ATCC 30864]|uniref:Zuotin, variant n=1 Tax=Capsaspora owczarzaki (strain ATCC 30864) TaxID=595528 RepID=A0A0D2UT52_CAPO3|nr:zuotin, variant [Capsaspora owczarzaki ATCC 30864]